MRGRGGNVAAVAAVAAVSVLAPALGLGVESCTDDHSQWCVNDDHVSTKTMQTIDGLGEAADAEKSQRNSIIDFVDPKLLDESNLDMIRSSLRSGKLVVINDAFTIEVRPAQVCTEFFGILRLRETSSKLNHLVDPSPRAVCGACLLDYLKGGPVELYARAVLRRKQPHGQH